jgi:hypothetical protein
MGIAEQFGHDREVRLVWHYLLPNQVRTSSRTPEQLEALRGKTIRLIDRIGAETRFEARPGPLCPWCEFGEICPANPARRPRTPEPEPPGPRYETC